jgi:hypothetical protein
MLIMAKIVGVLIMMMMLMVLLYMNMLIPSQFLFVTRHYLLVM